MVNTFHYFLDQNILGFYLKILRDFLSQSLFYYEFPQSQTNQKGNYTQYPMLLLLSERVHYHHADGILIFQAKFQEHHYKNLFVFASIRLRHYHLYQVE